MPLFLDKEPVTQATAFNALSRFGGVFGKRVLEVGGNSDCVAALPFALNEASLVLVTGLYHMDISSDPVHTAISLDQADALKLDEKYSEGSFDLVYGISVLEHIPEPAKFLAQVSHVLDTGGMAFLQGSPLWSGPWGHHIHLTPWQNGTTGCYQFFPSPSLLEQGIKTFNPIPDWGHLLYSATQLADHLTGLNVPDEDVEKIVSAVYTEDVINRESANSIMEAASNSGLAVVELEYDRVYLPSEIRGELDRLSSTSREDNSIMGIRIILRKN